MARHRYIQIDSLCAVQTNAQGAGVLSEGVSHWVTRGQFLG